jgi:hypothetical protein
MVKIFANSPECIKSELDLFYVPPTNTSITKGSWEECQTTHGLDSNVLEFVVKGNAQEYIHLNKTSLYLKISISKRDTDALKTIADTDAISCVNNLANSLFSQVDVKLNTTSLETSNRTYPYKAYLLDLLNFGEDAKETFMQSSLYYKDDANEFDTLNIIKATKDGDLNTNDGFLKRRKILLDGSGKVELLTKIHSDIFNSDRFLLNNIDINVTLYRSKDTFCLMHPKASTFEIKLEAATLFVRKCEITPSILEAHSLALQQATAKYPIKRVILKSFNLNANTESETVTVQSGNLPTRIVFGLVESESFNGAANKNPFNFKNFNLSELFVTVDSKNVSYNQPLKFNFEKNQYIRGYNTLFEGIDKPVYANGNYISRQDYPNGYALFAYDMSPDLCSGDHFNLIQTGKLCINMVFTKGLTTPVTLITLLEFDNMIEISETRQIILDYIP